MFPQLAEKGVHPCGALGPLCGLVTDIRVQGTDVGAVLIAAGPVILIAAPVSGADLSRTVISILTLSLGDRESLLHLFDQGRHLDVAPAPILVFIAWRASAVKASAITATRQIVRAD